ncbi:MAG: peptidyl-tRNA hydrolase [Wigglesworthia glossinidia]|nr:peptidyl-tRNA hydrolase [Wigglesworthia glossinidia]
MKLKMIVGLSNPIPKYSYTRHNIGELFINTLAKKYNKNLKKDKFFSCYYAKINIDLNNIILMIPDNYMNINGEIIYNFYTFYKIYPQELLIIHDELDLKIGCARFKFFHRNSSHNGIKSIVNLIEKKSLFHTLRIGIGRPKKNYDIKRYILSKLNVQELFQLKQIINKSINCINILIKKNQYHAMNILHKS